MQLPSDVYYSPMNESYEGSLEETKPQVVRVMQMKKAGPKKAVSIVSPFDARDTAETQDLFTAKAEESRLQAMPGRGQVLRI